MPTVAELGQKVKAKYPGAYDDIADDELGRRVKTKFPGSYDDFADSTGGAPMAAAPEPRTILSPRFPFPLAALPAAGGAVGGFLGGLAGLPEAGVGAFPMGVAGAGLGGTIGRAAQDALSGQKARDPFLAGGEQMAAQVLGRGAENLAGAAAKPLMRRALGVGRSLPGFSNTAETALKEGIAVSEGGLAKAARLRRESAEALTGLLAEARATGKTLNTRAVLKPVRDLLRSNVIPEEKKAAIMRDLVSFLGDKTARIDPLVLQEIKQYWGQRARAIYAPAGKQLSESAKLTVAPFETALAGGARRQLETIPGVAARNKTTQNLMGVERAVERAITRRPKAIELHKPGSYLGPIVGGAHTISRVALTLNSPIFRALLRQSPRAAAALVLDLTQDPDVSAVSP